MTFNKAPTLSASLVAQLVKNPPVLQETPVWFLVGKICWRRDRLPTPVFLDFPGGSVSKESACNAGDLVLIPGLERFPEGGQGFPGGASGKEPACQYRRQKRHVFDSWVGKIPWRKKWQPTPVFLHGESNGRGVWGAAVHRVTESQTQLKWLLHSS